MITFLLYTIVAWVANACIAKILYVSIQPGQWLDKLLNWQNRLHAWDMQGKEFLVKAGGMCELCFSHMVTFTGFWLYLFFMREAVDCWVTMNIETSIGILVINFTWYLCYIAVGTNMALYFITKLYRS